MDWAPTVPAAPTPIKQEQSYSPTHRHTAASSVSGQVPGILIPIPPKWYADDRSMNDRSHGGYASSDDSDRNLRSIGEEMEGLM